MRCLALRALVVGTLFGTAAAPGQPAAPPKAPQAIEWKSATPKTESALLPASTQIAVPRFQAPDKPVPTVDGRRPLPINLAAAMQLAGTQSLDVLVAARQVRIAAAQYDQAKYIWLPSVLSGVDYFRHDGIAQNVSGDLTSNSRSNFLAGGSLNAVFGINDAIFGPLAARQDLNARRANLQAVNNDTALAVAEAYFTVQQARGELAGALQYVKDAEALAKRTEGLAKDLTPPIEATRAKVELARRQQAVSILRERWLTSSAELLRLLRLEPSAVVEPVEPVNLTIRLIDPAYSLDDLVAIGLTSRPELAANQALVRATLQRLRQERLRPLVPSLVLRGASTNPAGTLGVGTFGAGTNSRIGDFHGRFDYDAQVLWELQGFGLTNLARIDQRKAEREAAVLELFRTQDRVAAEIAQAYAQAQSAAERLAVAEPAAEQAQDLFKKSLAGLTAKRVGELLVLIVRPQEVVAALQALAQANTDYYAAVADYNRAQFRLYRALGHPAQCLADITR
jgi:outer membrane protein TolC